jgi:hypothetical protein
MTDSINFGVKQLSPDGQVSPNYNEIWGVNLNTSQKFSLTTDPEPFHEEKPFKEEDEVTIKLSPNGELSITGRGQAFKSPKLKKENLHIMIQILGEGDKIELL